MWGMPHNADAIALGITSFVVGLSGAMMPGSLLVATVQETLSRGISAWPLVTGGHALSEFLMLVALSAGLGLFLASPGVAGIAAVAGGLLLAWFGYTTVRQSRTLCLDRLQEEGAGAGVGVAGPAGSTFLLGVSATFSNPYWFLWWATVGAGYIALALPLGWIGLAAVYLGHISADITWYGIVSAVLVKGRSFISNRLYRGVLFACGLFLVICALYFVGTGIHLMLNG